MRSLHAFRSTMTILGLAVFIAIGLSLLPERPYQRWQLLEGTIYTRARWVYERIHYDPTPIDVAFIGPSRVGAAVDAPRLSASLEERGLPSNVVNFSLAEEGRNINYVIVDELLKTKRPKLIVIGVTEKPSRFGHPTFKFLAPRSLILNPGYPTALNYFSDLIYVPFRQAKLFAAYLAPDVLGPAAEFRPEEYSGPHVDTTGDVVLPDGEVKNATDPASMAELERGVRKLESGVTPPILPERYADWEFGDDRHYIRQIADLAERHDVKIAFLFLPYYTGPSSIQERDLYDQFGPIWMADFVTFRSDLFADYGHLTSYGADLLTDWLVDPMAKLLASERRP